MNNTFLKLPPSMRVSHMEGDHLIPGQILYSDRNILHTTDGSNITVVFNFWEAGGISIVGFSQTPDDVIVFVDQYKNCLRLYNRLQGIVS